jgi:hypothetical protein
MALRWVLGLVLMGTLLGCGPSRRTRLAPEDIPFVAQTASRSQLLAQLESTGNAIQTLQAKVSLLATGGGLSTDVFTEYPETTGDLLARRPSHIHMQGRYLAGFVAVFDMVSDGDIFRVSLPTKNQLITGPTSAVIETDNPVNNLRPQHIMEALFVDVTGYLEDPGVIDVFEEVRDGRMRFYVLSFVDIDQARLLEKIWIDRRDLMVTRKQVFGELGEVETDVTYTEYGYYGDVSYPRRIHVQKPVIDYEVTILFEDIQLNLPTQDAQFQLPTPPGYEVIVLDDVNERDETASNSGRLGAESP